MKNLRLKGLHDDQCGNLLSNKFNSVTKVLFLNEFKNKGRKLVACCFSNEIKEFAITLNYYSPKALEYCR